MNRRLLAAMIAAAVLVPAAPAMARASTPSGFVASTPSGFVQRSGTVFLLNGAPFRFFGANNPTLQYKPASIVDSILDSAVAMHLKVIRAFAFVDRGSLDGSVPTVHPDRGAYTQYWDPAAGRPAYNDGPDGLQRVDYLLAGAARRGLKVELALTDNNRDVGGVEQYLAWYGLTSHDQFFTDARVRQAYKDWAAHLVNHVNVFTGTRYRDDPAILSWELANGPRCYGTLEASSGCVSSTITGWAGEMSAYLKSIDPNHLVGVGDEGFTQNGSPGMPDNPVAEGVDHIALTALPNVDFATYQIHTDAWGETDAWIGRWTGNQGTNAGEAGKPLVLDDFDRADTTVRDGLLGSTLGGLYGGTFGGNGWIVHTLGGRLPGGAPEPDVDGMTLYQPSSTATVLSTLASAEGFTPPDSTAPLAPGTPFLTGTPFQGTATLAWPRALDNSGSVAYRVLQISGGTVTVVAQPTDTFPVSLTGLVAGQRYTFAVDAHDAAGNLSPRSATMSFTMPGSVDLPAPTPPGNVHVTAVTAATATISWTAGADPVQVTGYELDQQLTPVEQQQTGQQSRPVASTAGATSVTVRYLRPGTQYTFQLYTTGFGFEGHSAPVTVAVTTTGSPPPDTSPPTTPGQLSVTDLTATGATLTWPASIDNVAVTGYQVQRLAGSAWTALATSTGSQPSATLANLTPSTAYTIAVIATDQAGNLSPRSAAVTFTTSAPGTSSPSTPGTPVASAITSAGVTLTWPPSFGHATVTGYRVVRLNATGETTVATPAGPSATLTGLTPATTYTYAVYALDSTGNISPRSATVTLTTLPPASCTVAYAVNDWGGGFTAQLTITNTSSLTLTGWTLNITNTGNQKLTQGWSATWSQNGTTITAANQSWNATIAPGASTGIGFNATYTGSNPKPAAITVNGATCLIT